MAHNNASFDKHTNYVTKPDLDITRTHYEYIIIIIIQQVSCTCTNEMYTTVSNIKVIHHKLIVILLTNSEYS